MILARNNLTKPGFIRIFALYGIRLFTFMHRI
jgi:hypothetical protein